MKFELLFRKSTLVMLILLVSSVYSETHTIQFGGTVGFAYSPNSLNVKVGDVIVWQGNFSFHPMSSVTVPDGAQTWNVTSGNEFQYTVQVPGIYDYRCDAHFQNGMVGSFTAEAATVVDRKLSSGISKFGLEQNYPNPFNPETKIVFSIPELRNVRLSIFNILGKEVAVLINEMKEPGKYEISLNASDYNLTSGIYVYQLRSGNFLDTKKFTLLK